MNASPFDALAPTYDADFTASPIAAELRNVVHQRLERYLRSGDSALELGCGTGEDALFLARRGVRVHATDSSEGMLAAARAKTASQPLVTVSSLDLTVLPEVFSATLFDGAYANFGVLNCLDDWGPLAAWLARRVRPGGLAAFAVMSPLCLWEIAWHSLHGNFRTAFRRLRRDTVFDLHDAAAPLPIYYPSVGRLSRDFAPWFDRITVSPLGLFLPPTDVYGVIERRAALLGVLIALDRRTRSAELLAPFADHYWIEFRRRAVDAPVR